VRDAEHAFMGFLNASRDGYSGARIVWDTIMGCDPPKEPAFPLTMLARFSVLPSGMRGDTVVASAAVVSVAEQNEDERRPGRYIAMQRVRTDTLEWDVVPDQASGRWLVCNGIQFGFVGSDSLTIWRGQATSALMARELAARLFRGEP
jgi:hypothetical protein